MERTLWVVAEHWKGEVTDVTFEMLAMAAETGYTVEVVLAGPARLAAQLRGASRAFVVDHPLLEIPLPETQAEAVANLAETRRPSAILVGTTNVSLGTGVLIAARLGVAFTNFCREIRSDNGSLTAKCLLYGGKIEATVAPQMEPAVFGVLSGCRSAEAGRLGSVPAVERIDMQITEPAVTLERFLEPEPGAVDVARQDVLVCVGRGIQSKENIAAAEDVARALGGVVCGSRPVIDQGWLPLSLQVGKSGRIVKPKLYLAAGVSGAPEHVEGMKDAEVIIAINSDPGAPIFNVAHYGIVGDALEVLPALSEELAARRG